MKYLIYEKVVEMDITHMDYMCGTPKVIPEYIEYFSILKIALKKVHLFVDILSTG